MIVVVTSDKRVLTGWRNLSHAESWLNEWLLVRRDRFGFVTQTMEHELYSGPDIQLDLWKDPSMGEWIPR